MNTPGSQEVGTVPSPGPEPHPPQQLAHQKHAVGVQVDPQLDAVDDLLPSPLGDPEIGDQSRDRNSEEPAGWFGGDSCLHSAPGPHLPAIAQGSL